MFDHLKCITIIIKNMRYIHTLDFIYSTNGSLKTHKILFDT